MRNWKLVLAAGLMLAVAACGKPTKEAMLQKVGEPKKKSEVVALLGHNVTLIATTEKTKN
jgi:hypothetical protein